MQIALDPGELCQNVALGLVLGAALVFPIGVAAGDLVPLHHVVGFFVLRVEELPEPAELFLPLPFLEGFNLPVDVVDRRVDLVQNGLRGGGVGVHRGHVRRFHGLALIVDPVPQFAEPRSVASRLPDGIRGDGEILIGGDDLPNRRQSFVKVCDHRSVPDGRKVGFQSKLKFCHVVLLFVVAAVSDRHYSYL